MRCRAPGEEPTMFRVVIHWILSAIALMVVANIVPGFYVNDVRSALIAAAVIALAVLGIMPQPLKLTAIGLAFLAAVLLAIEPEDGK